MNKSDIAKHHLINQQIAETKCTTPVEIVHWLGAVQAQDYAMAKWAIALRLPGGTNQIIENAIDNGDIIRTHVLRPTWHFAAASDIRWMLQLTASNIKKAASSMYKKLELDDRIFAKTNQQLKESLEGGRHLTRQELMLPINKAGIITDALRAMHIMFQAELDGIVCNGSRRDKQFTYALLDERVPPSTKTFTRNEALAELANRYFTSHGPATIQDFTWWSGLPITDARLALELTGSNFISETIEEQTYWFSTSSPVQSHKTGSIYLLPAYDEYMVSYKDRTASLLPQYTRETITGNGIFRPIIVVNGKVKGLRKRTIEKNKTSLELLLFNPSKKFNNKKIAMAAKKYSAYLNSPIKVLDFKYLE